MNRKLICLLIAIIMVFTCISTGMFAEGEDVVTEDSLASLIRYLHLHESLGKDFVSSILV